MNFTGQIKVASRIIDYLSSGLYHTPAACLKEIINNAYDADATIVKLSVKPDAGRIIISDNGCGISQSEFTKHFDRISESHKRDTGDSTQLGRKKVGKIGIGFIAANELCESMEIYSTKAGSTDLLHVTIDFKEMRKPIEARRSTSGDIVKADYNGEILTEDKDEHYTQIILTEVRGEAQRILSGIKQRTITDQISLYGKKPETILSFLRETGLKTWRSFDFYSTTMLEISLNIPVRYSHGWIPKSNPTISLIEKSLVDGNFTVIYDGTELFKPIVFKPQLDNYFISEFAYEGENVSAKGYFYVQHGTIKPQEIQGLLVRIRNAAVGEYDPGFWGFPSTENGLIQKWVSMEVYADDRLEEAMNIDRRTLRETHPAYAELQQAIHTKLREILTKARKDLYQVASNNRRESRIINYKERAVNAVSRVQSFSPQLARQIESTINAVEGHTRRKTEFESQYFLPDIYIALINAADGLIEEQTISTFIERFSSEVSKISKD